MFLLLLFRHTPLCVHVYVPVCLWAHVNVVCAVYHISVLNVHWSKGNFWEWLCVSLYAPERMEVRLSNRWFVHKPSPGPKIQVLWIKAQASQVRLCPGMCHLQLFLRFYFVLAICAHKLLLNLSPSSSHPTTYPSFIFEEVVFPVSPEIREELLIFECSDAFIVCNEHDGDVKASAYYIQQSTFVLCAFLIIKPLFLQLKSSRWPFIVLPYTHIRPLIKHKIFKWVKFLLILTALLLFYVSLT